MHLCDTQSLHQSEGIEERAMTAAWSTASTISPKTAKNQFKGSTRRTVSGACRPNGVVLMRWINGQMSFARIQSFVRNVGKIEMAYKITFWQKVLTPLSALALGFAAVASSAADALSPALAPPDISCDACKIILLNPGSAQKDSLDTQIAQVQGRVKTGPNSAAQIERLGWLFVEKARVSNDPGFYKLAEQCALCLESAKSNSLDALLLRGHVLHSLHRFKEAEALALELTKKRELAFDFGLLGDVEYDQGKIPEAVAAYQKMVDLRPDLQAYSRIGQIRWLKGDLSGAVEAMTMAAQAGSPLNAEPTAWTYSRLALLQLQRGDFPAAHQSASIALQLQSNSAPAWLALGRIQLAAGETNAAVKSLAKAADLNHLPEAQWALADAMRLAGRLAAAEGVEKELQQRGASEDPRSFSLFLSTRGQQSELTASRLPQVTRNQASRSSLTC